MLPIRQRIAENELSTRLDIIGPPRDATISWELNRAYVSPAFFCCLTPIRAPRRRFQARAIAEPRSPVRLNAAGFRQPVMGRTERWGWVRCHGAENLRHVTEVFASARTVLNTGGRDDDAAKQAFVNLPARATALASLFARLVARLACDPAIQPALAQACVVQVINH
jgi:hypothetical protein